MHFGILMVFLLIPFLAGVAHAQDYESTAESAIEYQRFPWQQSGQLSEFPREDPGTARSADRNSIPKRVQRNTNWPNFSIPGGWFSFFNGLIWVIIISLIAIAATALIYMYLKMDKTVAGRRSFEDYDQEDITERIRNLPFELQRHQPGNLIQLARQLAQEGNYSRAMMFLFSHVLLSLDKHELIRLKRGKTNRQYLNELRRHRNISEYYRRVMVPFEDAFFGNYTISEGRFEECWNGLQQFETNIDTATQVPAP